MRLTPSLPPPLSAPVPLTDSLEEITRTKSEMVLQPQEPTEMVLEPTNHPSPLGPLHQAGAAEAVKRPERAEFDGEIDVGFDNTDNLRLEHTGIYDSDTDNDTRVDVDEQEHDTFYANKPLGDELGDENLRQSEDVNDKADRTMYAETALVAAHGNSTDTELVGEDHDRNLLRIRTINLTPIEQEVPSITTIDRTVANLLLITEGTAPLPVHGASTDVDPHPILEPPVADSFSQPGPSVNALAEPSNASLMDTDVTNGSKDAGLESASDVQPETNPVVPDQTSIESVGMNPVTDASGSTTNRDVTETVNVELGDDTIPTVVESADPSTLASNPDLQTQNDRVDPAEAQKTDSQQPTTEDVGAELNTTQNNIDSDSFADPFDDPFSAADDDQSSLDAAKQIRAEESLTGKAPGQLDKVQPNKEDDIAGPQPPGVEQATSQKDDVPAQPTNTSEILSNPVELPKKDEETSTTPGSGVSAESQPSKDSLPAQALDAEPDTLRKGDDTPQSIDTPKDTSSSVFDVQSKLEVNRQDEPPGELDLADTEMKPLQGDTEFRRRLQRRDTGASSAGSFVSALDFFIPDDAVGDDEAEVDVTEMPDPDVQEPEGDGMNAETTNQPNTMASGVGEADQVGSWFSLSFQRAWDRFSQTEESKDIDGGGTDATGGAVDLPPQPEEIAIVDDIDSTKVASNTEAGQTPVVGASDAGGSVLEMQPDTIVTGLDKSLPDEVQLTLVGEGSSVTGTDSIIPQARDAAVNAADEEVNIVDAKEEGNGSATTILLDLSSEPLKTDRLAAPSAKDGATSADETGQKDSATAKFASVDSSQAPAAESVVTVESTNPDQLLPGDGVSSARDVEDSKGDVGDKMTPLGPQVADTIGSSVPQDTSAPPKVEKSENPSASSEPLADGSKGEVSANPAPPTSTQQDLEPLNTSNSNNPITSSDLPAGPENKVGESTNDVPSSNTQQLLDALDMNVFNDESTPVFF
uniref:Uncharacterized protein n=1 Tax=Moniliophthora roreri TaxID=221103 RepID=A0A0W0GDE8_MONRR